MNLRKFSTNRVALYKPPLSGFRVIQPELHATVAEKDNGLMVQASEGPGSTDVQQVSRNLADEGALGPHGLKNYRELPFFDCLLSLLP